MSSNHDHERPGPAGEDPNLEQAWRQASDEQPPARLDVAILAAARRSVVMKDADAKAVPALETARSRWRSWQPLAAAATVAGLALVLVQTIPRDQEVAPPIHPRTPASAATIEREFEARIPSETPPTGAAPDVVLESRSSTPASEIAETAAPAGSGRTVRDQSADSATQSRAVDVTADVATVLRDPRREAESDQRKSVMSAEAGEAISAAAGAPSVARATAATAPPSAGDWVARIEDLYQLGDLAGAAEILREFRAADPDAESHLPENLRGWARSVN